MILAGFQKTSFVDYPGNICATIFTHGCNMRCPYCHNSKLVTDPPKNSISETDVLDYLHEKRHLLDGICISGGEPTLQKDLLDFIKKVKAIGIKVKLDSNGSNPNVLRKVLPFIDFIAMDVKQLPEKYEHILNTKVSAENLIKSIELIKKSGIDYEFRLTVVPECTTERDVIEIAKYLKGSTSFALQQFVPSENMFDTSLTNTYSADKLKELSKLIEPYFDSIEVRL